MFYTYAHYKPNNSIFYIGKGRGRRAWGKDNRNNHWLNIVAKYGDPKVQILAEWQTEEEALEHEKLLVMCFRDMGCAIVNMTDGGEGVSGYKHTPESTQKRLESMRGHIVSDATKAKMREAHLGENNHFFGQSHSEESKAKISKKKQGCIGPWAGKLRSEETRRKISIALSGRPGRKHTEESRRKLSMSHLGKKQASPSEETRKKLSESVKASWIARRQKAEKGV